MPWQHCIQNWNGISNVSISILELLIDVHLQLPIKHTRKTDLSKVDSELSFRNYITCFTMRIQKNNAYFPRKVCDFSDRGWDAERKWGKKTGRRNLKPSEQSFTQIHPGGSVSHFLLTGGKMKNPGEHVSKSKYWDHLPLGTDVSHQSPRHTTWLNTNVLENIESMAPRCKKTSQYSVFCAMFFSIDFLYSRQVGLGVWMKCPLLRL